MTKREQEKQDFIRRVVSASKIPSDKATILATKLWKMSGRSSRLAEAACNRELTKAEDALDDKMDAKVKEIGKLLGLKAYREGDPRGWTIRVVVGKELANNWDGLTTGCG